MRDSVRVGIPARGARGQPGPGPLQVSGARGQLDDQAHVRHRRRQASQGEQHLGRLEVSRERGQSLGAENGASPIDRGGTRIARSRSHAGDHPAQGLPTLDGARVHAHARVHARDEHEPPFGLDHEPHAITTGLPGRFEGDAGGTDHDPGHVRHGRVRPGIGMAQDEAPGGETTTLDAGRRRRV